MLTSLISLLVASGSGSDAKSFGQFIQIFIGECDMNVIGKRVVGNWGAGIPENEGTIYGIRDGHFAMVRWDDCEYAEPDSIFGSKAEYAISSIKEKGCTSKNGSSIGVFYC